MSKRFIKKLHLKKGALSRQLGIPIAKDIPKSLLKEIIRAKAGMTITNPTSSGRKRIVVTRLIERRSILALTLKNLKRRR